MNEYQEKLQKKMAKKTKAELVDVLVELGYLVSDDTVFPDEKEEQLVEVFDRHGVSLDVEQKFVIEVTTSSLKNIDLTTVIDWVDTAFRNKFDDESCVFRDGASFDESISLKITEADQAQ